MTAVHDNELTSWIMSINSASVGFCPRERMTVPSSLVVMVPMRSKKETKRMVSAILQYAFYRDASTDGHRAKPRRMESSKTVVGIPWPLKYVICKPGWLQMPLLTHRAMFLRAGKMRDRFRLPGIARADLENDTRMSL